ncbi:hypothetical protein AGABI1DRAFT_70131 [Agaricus bisporus var. burnettii JB137-S8]|uniref:Uncharacterized protein n=1 Tax=Agaricus bisporus var. burnettii (strain JB137-S8 / ATCC MYA-4627 / FGSC 10392) TaxID=597362 RepID=K5W4K2_AGABU|nr:uncharacterized protein AGABI1DRAFT_70131 [Agaricus bisporus var. burnettii JB137-S8]EKM81729.1 hypothetical protein AGABI1DRAFT_70131 [Agaricus bisporus var. burnettii JB137-S8]
MKNTTKIGFVLVISLAFFCAEIAVGFRTKSLALIADALHYLNDIVAYTIAFIAAYLQDSGQHTVKFTFAFHRAELVGAFFNGVFLLALAISILLQSIERFVHLEEIAEPSLVLIIGCVGLGLNIISVFVVHDHHGHGGHGHGQPIQMNDLNPNTCDHVHATHNHTIDPPISSHQHNLGLLGVLVHLCGDAVNNLAVIVAAIIIWKLDAHSRFYADPAVSLAISFIIFASAIPMTWKTGRILLEAVPLYIDLAKVKEDLLAIPDVLSIHDLHVWHLSQSVILASLHVCVPSGTSLVHWEQIEQTLQHCFQAYGISHVTISPELRRSESHSLSNEKGGCIRLSSEDDIGCSVNEFKKRRLIGDV